MSEFYFDPARIKTLYDYHQNRALSHVKAGDSYNPGDEPPPGPFKSVIEGILSPTRKTPNLMPYINGVAADLTELEKVFGNLINDQVAVLKNITYVEDPNGFPWANISSLHSRVTGKESRNSYEKAMDGLSKIVSVAHNPPSESPDVVRAWFIDTFTKGASYEGIDLIQGQPQNIAIATYERPANLPRLYVSKAKVPIEGMNPIRRISDPRLFEYTDKAGNPFPIEMFEDVPRLNPLTERQLDIEHSTRSVSLEGQEQLLAYYTELLNTVAYPALESAKSGGDAVQIAISEQVIKDIKKVLEFVAQKIELTSLVGRVFGDILPREAKSSPQKIKSLLNALPKNGDYRGIYIVQYNTTTSSLELNQVENQFYLEAAKKEWSLFMPGLLRANRGYLAALEKEALNDMRQFLFTKFSPSAVNTVLMSSLAKIFDEPAFLEEVKKYAGTRKKKSKPIFVPLYKEQKVSIKKGSPSKTIKASERKSNSGKVYRGTGVERPTSNREIDSNLVLLDLINANIYDAVIAQMRSPSLVNRTGTFARSVKATEVVRGTRGALGIKYSYLERPYNVFSRDSGKAPWNSVWQRDPAHIIDAAIKSIKFSQLLETTGRLGNE